jgi:hypothetical protein
MRDINRINAEIHTLETHFGADRIWWDSGYNWVMIQNWELPPRLNKTHTHMVVLIPPNYGNGEPLRDAFIHSEIRALNPKTAKFETIPHYFQEYPYASLNFGSKEEFRQKDWRYICIHQFTSERRINIRQYLNCLYVFLSDPFRNWIQTFNSYRR